MGPCVEPTYNFLTFLLTLFFPNYVLFIKKLNTLTLSLKNLVGVFFFFWLGIVLMIDYFQVLRLFLVFFSPWNFPLISICVIFFICKLHQLGFFHSIKIIEQFIKKLVNIYIYIYVGSVSVDVCLCVLYPRYNWCPRGVIVKAMDCRIVVSEFVRQSRDYVHFRPNTLGKGMNHLTLPAMA